MMPIVPIPQTTRGVADLALGIYDALKVLQDLVDFAGDHDIRDGFVVAATTEQRFGRVVSDAREVIDNWNYLAKPD